MKSILTSLLVIFSGLAWAQSVGVGTTTPHASAMLDVSSASKGLLIPRLTEAQKGQIANPATGLLIWQTDGTPGFYYNGGTPEGPKWYMLGIADETNWKLTGNSNVDSALHFLGSTNNAPLYFKVRNTWAGQLDSGKATHFGYKAGWLAPSVYNTAFGTEALAAPSDAARNTAFGFFAAKDTRSGEWNTAVGSLSLSNNVSGNRNTAIGTQAMYLNVSGHYNTAVGANALYATDTGRDNTAIGYLALQFNKSSNNTALGSLALYGNTLGIGNTAIGRGSLNENSIGSENVAVGNYTLQYNTIYGGNTAVGHRALQNNNAEGNTALGHDAARLNTSGNGITAIGFDALKLNTTGNNNTALGGFALPANTTGFGNTAIGKQALFSNTVGIENVAVGNFTLANLTTSGGNTAIGHNALEKNLAEGNTAVGHDAARNNTIALGITAIGFDALKENTSGSHNTGLGINSLLSNTTGTNNSAMGSSALRTNNTGENNTAVGYFAGSVNISGSGNTFLGRSANPSNGIRNNATAIGFRSTVACDNCMVLGSVAGVNAAESSVNVGIGTTSPNEVLTINASNPILQLQHDGASMGFFQITGGQDVKVGTNITNNLGSFFIRTNGGDRVKVDPSGNVGIGTTNPTVRFQVGTNGDGTVARANAWQTFSDERYKTNIEEIPNALEKIETLHGYYYHWKSGKDETRQAGLLAQEVEKVLPEIVSNDADGYKSVDYGKMNALLIQAIKEQQKEIDELKALLKSRKSK